MKDKLLARRRRAVEDLPPIEEILRGSIIERSVRCGQPSCRCAKGVLHAATVLTVTFPGGRTEQISLPAAVLPTARGWVRNYLRWWQIVEKISAINRDLLRQRRREDRTRLQPRRGRRRRSSS